MRAVLLRRHTDAPAAIKLRGAVEFGSQRSDWPAKPSIMRTNWRESARRGENALQSRRGNKASNSPNSPYFKGLLDFAEKGMDDDRGAQAVAIIKCRSRWLFRAPVRRSASILHSRRQAVPRSAVELMQAKVAELVDAPDLGSGAVRRESSSLSFRTSTVRRRAGAIIAVRRRRSPRALLKAAFAGFFHRIFHGLPFR